MKFQVPEHALLSTTVLSAFGMDGLPVTLKDQYRVKGVETSMGHVGWIGTFEGQEGSGKENSVESGLSTLGAVPITLVSDRSQC